MGQKAEKIDALLTRMTSLADQFDGVVRYNNELAEQNAFQKVHIDKLAVDLERTAREAATRIDALNAELFKGKADFQKLLDKAFVSTIAHNTHINEIISTAVSTKIQSVEDMGIFRRWIAPKLYNGEATLLLKAVSTQSEIAKFEKRNINDVELDTLKKELASIRSILEQNVRERIKALPVLEA